jgi:hypothetical protein
MRTFGLLTWGLFVCLFVAPAQVASAQGPTQEGKRAPEGTQQDNADSEKSQRDAAGLITIEGTVVDESGSPVPNARVQLDGSMDSASKTLSDSQGHFRFRFIDLPTAKYLVFVADSRKDGTKGYLNIIDHSALGLPAPVQIVLKPPRELLVAVNDRAGAPVVGALIGIMDVLLEGRAELYC